MSLTLISMLSSRIKLSIIALVGASSVFCADVAKQPVKPPAKPPAVQTPSLPPPKPVTNQPKPGTPTNQPKPQAQPQAPKPATPTPAVNPNLPVKGDTKSTGDVAYPKDAIKPGMRGKDNLPEMPEDAELFTADESNKTVPIDAKVVSEMLEKIHGVITSKEGRSLVSYDDTFLKEGDIVPGKGTGAKQSKTDADTRIKILTITKHDLLLQNGSTQIRIPLALTRDIKGFKDTNRPLYSISEIVANGIFISNGLLLTSYQAIKTISSLELEMATVRVPGTVISTPNDKGGADLNLAFIEVTADSTTVLPQNLTYFPTKRETLYYITDLTVEGKMTFAHGLYSLEVYPANANDTSFQLIEPLPIFFAGCPVFNEAGEVIGVLSNPLDNNLVDRVVKISYVNMLMRTQASLKRSQHKQIFSPLTSSNLPAAIPNVMSVTKYYGAGQEKGAP